MYPEQLQTGFDDVLAHVALQPLEEEEDDDESPDEEEELISSQEKFLESISHPLDNVLVQPAFVKPAAKPQQGFPPFLQTNVYPEQLHAGSVELDAQVALQPLEEEEEEEDEETPEEEELEVPPLQKPASATQVVSKLHPGRYGISSVQHGGLPEGQVYS